MIKNRTAQLIYLSMATAFGLVGAVASLGLFMYQLRWDFYIHFTNLSNYFCLAVLFAELIQTARKKEDSCISACPLLKFMGLLAILLTFIVFNVMLAPAREPSLNFTVNSIMLHVVMPILYILDWFLFYERKKVKWYYPLYSTLFPLCYTIFVFLHAAILKFDSSIRIENSTVPLIYPYFFLNLETQGVGGVLMWIGIIFVAFVSMGFIFFGIDKISKKKSQITE